MNVLSPRQTSGFLSNGVKARVVIRTLLAAALGLRPIPSPAQEKYVVKIATIAPEGTSWSEYAHAYTRFVSEKTQGRAKVVWYFGGVEGDEPDVVRKIRLGQLHGGGFTLAGLGKLAPEVKILELPFLFRTYDEVDEILRALGRDFSDIFSRRGYVLAGWLEVGFVHFFSKASFRSIDDLRQTKMWTWSGDALAEETLRALGLTIVVPLALTDVLASLQSGLINAFYGPSYAIIALQWHTQVKYVSDFSLAYTPGAIVLDKKFYDSLPSGIRKVMDEGWRIYLPRLKDAIRKDEDRALDSLKDSGIVMTHTDDGSLKEAQDRVRPLYKEFAGTLYPPSLLARLLDRLEKYRAAR